MHLMRNKPLAESTFCRHPPLLAVLHKKWSTLTVQEEKRVLAVIIAGLGRICNSLFARIQRLFSKKTPCPLGDGFHCRCIKEILLAVTVGRCCNDNEVCILICNFSIKCSSQIQVLLSKIFFNVFVLDGRFALIDEVNFLRNNIYCHDLVVLRQQRSNGQTDIVGTSNCNFLPFTPYRTLCTTQQTSAGHHAVEYGA